MTALVIERPVELPVEAPATPDPDRLVVMVRQEHIDRGVRGRANECAIAQAAAESGIQHASMGFGSLSGWREGHWTWWVCPAAREFVFAFDDGEPVRPTRFVFTRLGAA